MTQRLVIHPQDPQPRLIKRVMDALQNGDVIAYPTDSAYALGCQIGYKEPMERIRRIRNLSPSHNFTLVCKDLSELSHYALFNNSIFRLLKANTPGPYTYILNATKEVPRRLQHPKRQTIGLRIPDNKIAQAILAELGQPLLSVTLVMPGDEHPLVDPDEIFDRLEGKVDIVVDGGICGLEPTTVVDFVDGAPKIVREGKGDVTPFL